MKSIILGIDPGFSGALAWYDANHGALLKVVPMPLKAPKILIPDTRKEIDAIRIGALLGELRPVLTVIERVHSSPQMGVASSFRFGEGYGLVMGVLSGFACPIREVIPSVWKGALNLSGDKRKSTKLAELTFPNWKDFASNDKASADLAEAALLAHYGRRFMPLNTN